MNEVYLLTGGNMGERWHNLQQACKLIEETAGEVVKKSPVYETAAWGFTEQEPFLNQVLCIASALEADELLQCLLDIELELGRRRIYKMGPRVIDIDILFYGSQILSLPDLVIPHPRIAERRFVLTPLNDIAPDFIHPVFDKSISALLKDCSDTLEVKLYEPGEEG